MQREQEALEGTREGIVGAREIPDEVVAAVQGRSLRDAEAGQANGREGQGHVGHHVDLPAEVALDNNATLSDLYAEVTGRSYAYVISAPTSYNLFCPFLFAHICMQCWCHGWGRSP